MDKQVNLAQNPALTPEERERQLEGEKTNQNSEPDYRRSTYLIDQDFQYRFATTWIASMMLYVGLICLSFYWAVGVAETSTQRERFTMLLADASTYVGVFVLLLTVLFGIYFLLLSHRISGPAYRLTETLKQMSNGNFDFTVRLRKSDYLKSLADALNTLLESLRERNQSLKEVEHQVVALQENLEEREELDEEEELAERCEEIHDKLRSIRTPDDRNQDSESSDEE